MEAVRPHLFLYDTNHSDYMKSKLNQDISTAVTIVLNLSNGKYEGRSESNPSYVFPWNRQ